MKRDHPTLTIVLSSGLSVTFLDRLLPGLLRDFGYQSGATELTSLFSEINLTFFLSLLCIAVAYRYVLNPLKSELDLLPWGLGIGAYTYFLSMTFLIHLLQPHAFLLSLQSAPLYLLALIFMAGLGLEFRLSLQRSLLAAPLLGFLSCSLLIGNPWLQTVLLGSGVLSLLASIGAYRLTRRVSQKRIVSGVTLSPIILLLLIVAEGLGVTSLTVLILAAALALTFVVLPSGKRFSSLGLPVLVFLSLGLSVVPPAIAVSRSIDLRSQGTDRSVTQPTLIILITVDTLRAKSISPYGGPVPTPNIERLAAKGTLYEHAVSPSSWTLPALSSIHSGLLPNVHQTNGRTPLAPMIPTLAERLTQAGFHTGAIVVSEFLDPFYGLNQGFEDYRFYQSRDFLLVDELTISGFLAAMWEEARFLPRHLGKTPASSDEITNMAIDWLGRNVGRRSFLWIHYFDPHSPYAPPTEFRPVSSPPKGWTYQFGMVRDLMNGTLILNSDERHWVRELYESEIKYIDSELGRLVDFLDERKLFDSSLLVFSSDHGEEFWEHGRWGHGHSLHSEVLDVPLIVKPFAKDFISPRRVAQACSTVRIPATILSMAGLQNDELPPPPLRLDWAGDFPVFSSGLAYYDKQDAVLYHEKKLVRSVLTGQGWTFDVRADPNEHDPAPKTSPWRSESDEHLEQLLNEMDKNSELRRRELGLSGDSEQAPSEPLLRRLRSLGYVR